MTNDFEEDFDLNQQDCTPQPDDLAAGQQRNLIDESAPAESIAISTQQQAPQDSLLESKSSCANKMSVHFSSATVEWPTPQYFFDELAWIFGGFDLDPCATPENAKCARFFTETDDGLSQSWHGGENGSKVFMNPPYGRNIGKWVKKAYEESFHGALVVCLLPARVDTAWWHDYAQRGFVHFVRGRLKFGGAKNSAPFPSAIVIFGKLFSSEIALLTSRGQYQLPDAPGCTSGEGAESRAA